MPDPLQAPAHSRFKDALEAARLWFVPVKGSWGAAPGIVILCGLVLVLFGVLAESLLGAMSGSPAILDPNPYFPKACKQLTDGYQKAKETLAQESAASLGRSKLLTQALATETRGDVRAYLEQEKAEAKRLDAFKRMHVTIIGPWGWYSLVQLLLVSALLLGLLLAIRLLSRQYQQAFLRKVPTDASQQQSEPGFSQTPLMLLCLAVLLGLAVHTARSQFWVGEKKTWLVWDSACINPMAFFLGRIPVLLGVGLVAAAFCSLIWTAASERDIHLDVKHADGACGQRTVMRFYKIWLRLPLLILMGGYYLFVAFAKETIGSPGDDAAGYGTVSTCLVLIWGVLAARIYLRVQKTQEKFDEALAGKLFKTTPQDPTQEIFGGLWWEVPIGLATTLAAMYSLLHLETFLGK